MEADDRLLNTLGALYAVTETPAVSEKDIQAVTDSQSQSTRQALELLYKNGLVCRDSTRSHYALTPIGRKVAARLAMSH